MEEDKSCLRCGNISENGHKYCTNCGAPLVNKCTYDGGFIDDPCGHINHSKAAFCSKCGAPTLFYREKLISSPYTPIKKEEKIDHIEIEDLDDLF